MAKKLFVGGLSYSVNNAELEEHFAKVGKVISANIITDRATGQSKGFGFVEMDTEDEAKKAVDQLNGTAIGDRNIIVNEARPQENRTGGSNFSRPKRW